MTTRKIQKTPQQEADELRELIREAHGVLKDLHDQEKQARLVVRDLVVGVVMEEVAAATAAMHRAMNDAMDKNVQAVVDEFKAVEERCIDRTFSGGIGIEELTIAVRVITAIIDGAKERDLGEFDVQVTNLPKRTDDSKVPDVFKKAAKSAFEREAITLTIPGRDDLEQKDTDG